MSDKIIKKNFVGEVAGIFILITIEENEYKTKTFSSTVTGQKYNRPELLTTAIARYILSTSAKFSNKTEDTVISMLAGMIKDFDIWREEVYNIPKIIQIETELLKNYRKKLTRTEKEREAGKLLGNDTKKLSRRIREIRRAIRILENINEVMLELKPRTYYTAQISLSSTNAMHFAIIYVEADLDKGIQVFNHSYTEGVVYCDYTEIYGLKIINELEEIENIV